MTGMGVRQRPGRLVDIAVALLLLVVCAPLFVLIALWVAADSKGPIIYAGARVGRQGRIFQMLKFRTMVVDADRVGPELTLRADRRVTRAGRFLRPMKLDELPQLLNVLRGEMGLVGPRPETPGFVAGYDARQRDILELLPGLTDPATLEYFEESALLDGEGAGDLYVTVIMPHKIELNLAYAARATLWSDCVVVARTAARLTREIGRHLWKTLRSIGASRAL